MAELTHASLDRETSSGDLPTATAVIGGALLGGVAGFLFLTARGRRVRDELVRIVDQVFGGVDVVLDRWAQVQRLASETRSASHAWPRDTDTRPRREAPSKE